MTGRFVVRVRCDEEGCGHERVVILPSRYMDELAQSIQMDPLAFRLKNAKDERLRAVIIAAADKFGWKDRKKTSGRGYGIGAGFEKGCYSSLEPKRAVFWSFQRSPLWNEWMSRRRSSSPR